QPDAEDEGSFSSRAQPNGGYPQFDLTAAAEVLSRPERILLGGRASALTMRANHHLPRLLHRWSSLAYLLPPAKGCGNTRLDVSPRVISSACPGEVATGSPTRTPLNNFQGLIPIPTERDGLSLSVRLA